MAATPFDLYRIGDAIGVALDNARIGIDIRVYRVNDVDWVIAENRGVSMRSRMHQLRTSGGRWWRLPSGTTYSDELTLFADHGNHLMFVPRQDMPYAEYVVTLAELNARFV